MLTDTAHMVSPSVPAKPLPVAVCVVVGDVLGSTIYHHARLETLFYEAGALGEVPPGNCVVKCQSWLKRMHIDVANPIAVLGKVLEQFMDVDHPYDGPARKRIIDTLAKFGLSYHQGGLILGGEMRFQQNRSSRFLPSGI